VRVLVRLLQTKCSQRAIPISRFHSAGALASERPGAGCNSRTRSTIGAVLGFALTDHWGPANSQQPIAPELRRPPICDQFNVDGRASAPLRSVSLPPQQTCTTQINNGHFGKSATARLQVSQKQGWR
jgi:hypothetical protein